ncbi:hypothetical protein [Spongiactinospora sp. TRM90649]|uniref:hypothetical protein n=1 Tax=Spongiactinospora sp. TRM90649 TaxID=3031114 RepID=UPI0023F7478A|nr:hypothetical protein [Spongiactinospora sp. TRM90649]MDF5758581.1 hypothetical protein [Spongiactinospora sp. TRM90649]
MTWFKVDDSLHSHPKAMAASLAALGLWTVAGSWSGDHLTDGFIPDHMIPSLSRGQSELAKELCAAGLWRRSKGGYQFHQWHEDGDGTARNPSREVVENTRAKRAAAGRKGGLASGKTRSKPRSNTEANASARASRIVEPPSRPVQSPKGTRTDTGSVVPSGPYRARDADDDSDDTVDLAIVQLLTELTGRDVGILHAASVRHRILDGHTIRTSRLAYVAKSIHNDPAKFLPAWPDEEPFGRAHLQVVPEPSEEPEWCGHCNPLDRTNELADGSISRCQECNPRATSPYRHHREIS